MVYILLLLFFVFISLGVLKFLNKSKKTLNGRHVVITGGSSGIGKAVGVLAAQQGAHVTLIARNIDRLSKAKEELEQHIKQNQKITTASVDVSNKGEVETNILELEEKVGPIYMLVNCAGLAICGKLEDLSESDINHLINVNLLGTIYPIQSILSKFKQRQEGIIVLTSSAVGLMGMFGFSIYSACKFALRGIAESLYMEAKPYNISVTFSMPPDTNTPGFENENKSKPKETKLMSESGGLYSPDDVAKQLLNDALSGQFFSYVGFESFILATLCVGMGPFHSLFDLLVQSFLLGPLRLVAAFYVKHFENIVNTCLQESKDAKSIENKKY